MKFVFSILIICFFCLFACKKNKEINPIVYSTIDTVDSLTSTNIVKTWVFDSLYLEKRVYIDNDSAKQGMMIDLFFKYPISAPENINIDSLQIILSRIFSSENDLKLSPKEAFNYIMKEHETEALQYGEEWQAEDNEYIDFSNYYQSAATTEEITSKYILTISTAESAYYGGAHGSYNIKYDNIDLRNSKLIKEKDFFRAGYKQQVAKLIQKQIIKRNNSDDENDQIYLLVDIDEVKPNENFFFTKEGMVYTYNQYEIAPYVQGPVEITLPYEDIIPLVSNSYQYLIQNLMQQKQSEPTAGY